MFTEVFRQNDSWLKEHAEGIYEVAEFLEDIYRTLSEGRDDVQFLDARDIPGYWRQLELGINTEFSFKSTPDALAELDDENSLTLLQYMYPDDIVRQQEVREWYKDLYRCSQGKIVFQPIADALAIAEQVDNFDIKSYHTWQDDMVIITIVVWTFLTRISDEVIAKLNSSTRRQCTNTNSLEEFKNAFEKSKLDSATVLRWFFNEFSGQEGVAVYVNSKLDILREAGLIS